MVVSETLRFRPYARLLTMLGEQLIKNERIAIIELVKNSYDADASWVKISFENFGDDLSLKQNSKIIIEDNGIGMNEDIIRNHWVNPATPEKRSRKIKNSRTKMGRILQGEKGIGRFAMLKLGKKVDMYTRAENSNSEIHLFYDFSKFDDDFNQLNSTRENKKSDLFLDELQVHFESSQASIIDNSKLKVGLRDLRKSGHGTRIEITSLNQGWTTKKIRECYTDLSRLRSIFDEDIVKSNKDSFHVAVHVNDEYRSFPDDDREKLKFLLDERAVLKVSNGYFNQNTQEITFDLDGYRDGIRKKINLTDPHFNGLSVFWKHFSEKPKPKIPEPIFGQKRKPECGSFRFQFYIFDFTSKAPGRFKLDNQDKNLIKPHRVYLYRDSIRVFPYGDEYDDWLFIDQYRGTVSAGEIVSNNQIVGKVDISQDENQNLRDKTNREGLVEVGNAAHDFIGILKGILGYLSAYEFKRYKQDIKDQTAVDVFKTEKVQTEFDFALDAINEGDTTTAKKHLVALHSAYGLEREYLVQRAEATEDLAGVGLSVESASHDMLAMLQKSLNRLDSVIQQLSFRDVDIGAVEENLQTIRGMLSFVKDQMNDVQLLFRSTKQRRRLIRVEEVLSKVQRIYNKIFDDNNIKFKINKVGSPLVAKTTDAVLLQVLINLLDNAVYWLCASSNNSRKILITLDGDNNELICSDSGPGVASEDLPYIFEPFYSGKGEDGKGLGLYIAKQLLDRHEYSIEYGDIKQYKKLHGANFVVGFVKGS